jgi:putative SOS response-associated peptidase YedK
VERDRVTEPLQPDYNVAPTKPVYAVLTRRGRPQGSAGQAGPADAGGSKPADSKPSGVKPADSGKSAGGGKSADDSRAADSARPASQPAATDAADEAVARELRIVRWGLVPSWAKDISIGSRLINARAETVSEKPSFRRAFERRRCLLPADGYYEWQKPAQSAGTAGKGAPKQPFYITRGDGGPLAFAGLYELWRDPAHPDGDPDAWLWTAAIITTSAPDDLGQIHDRMPMVIDPASWADWLDPDNRDAADLRALLAPAVAGGLISYPVSRAVNSVRNNGPELIEPADASDRAEPAALASGQRPAGSGRRNGAAREVPDGEPGTLF